MTYADSGGLLGLTITMMVFSVLAVVLRFFTRFFKKAPLLWDDWLILPSLLILLVMCILTLVGVHGHGEGYATPESPADGSQPDRVTLTLKISFAVLLVEALQLMFAKLSILFFYRRIFCGSKGNGTSIMSISLWVMIGLTIVWGFSFFFANLFECGTVWPANWGLASSAKYCIKEQKMNEAYFYSDFIIDFLIFVLPIYKVWSLQMSTGRKVAVLGILAIGALAMVASAIKVGIVVELGRVVSSGFTSADKLLIKDQDLLASVIIFWCILESGIATIVACMPTLNSLIHGTPNLLRSLRSVLSINSLGSNTNRSQRSHKSQTRLGSSDHQSQSSQAEINKLEALEAGMGSQAYAMKDLSENNHPNSKGITVKNYVTQDSSDHV